MLLNKFSEFYERFEKYISPLGLIYGFIFTSLTLTRVDMFIENFWIVLHLLIASFGILALTYYENYTAKKSLTTTGETVSTDKFKFHFYLTLMIQFAFGGLFSTFFVFYMRSSTLTQSWLFIFFLLVLLIGNELWKKHYARLAFQTSILFISLYLFLVFLLPVLFHRLSALLFVLSGISALLIIYLFVLILKRFALEKFKNSHQALRMSILSIFVLMNVLYFTNIIPPIPLALKDSGVYHSVTRLTDGNYEVSAEVRESFDYFTRYKTFHKQVGEPIYVFISIFSPVKFSTEIIHQWQFYDAEKKDWINSSKITVPISGGRAEGYRTYSFKQAVSPGLWRVRVLTMTDQVLGNVNFAVENVSTPVPVTKQIF